MSENKRRFVHMHVHDTLSLLDGIAKPLDIVKNAKAYGMTAVARTNHGNMYNAISFHEACRENGVKAILGYEAYVAPDDRKNRSYGKDSEIKKELGDIAKYAYHLTILAKNRQGYENIKKLVTAAHREGFYYKPRIDMQLLAEYKEGLIILSGCLASLSARYIVDGQIDKAMEVIDKNRMIFGEDFYLELMHHDIPEEDILTKALLDISKTRGIPCVMTNDSHYSEKSDVLAHEVALCIGTHKTINDPTHWKFSGSGYWFKTIDEMYEAADEAGIPHEALENTQSIADKVEDYDLKVKNFAVPLFRGDDGEPIPSQTCDQMLELQAWKGLAERGLQNSKEHQERLTYELALIKKKNFSSYFLIIADAIDFMRKSGIMPPPGRGSSVGSLTCYCLFITGLDPIKYGVPFSRFINEGRKDLPDIDTDISQARRPEVIKYLINKYGADRVAQITTFSTLAAKQAIKDVARVLSIPSKTADNVAKLLGDTTKDDKLVDLLENNKEARKQMEIVPNWIKIATTLEGNYKSTGEHAAGIVICNEPIANVVPLDRDSKDGHLVTQYDMKDLSSLGLLKLDMLGLKTLDLIQYTIELIEKRRGIKIDPQSIPTDDKATYNTISSSTYVSVFQYDSNGIRQVARQLQPNKFEHLIALNALYRPGPMTKDETGKSVLERYIDRRHEREKLDLWHPDLEPILKSTYNLVVFQEQIMGMAKIIAKFDDTEADEYRAAIGKKDKVKFEAVQKKFTERGIANGHSQEFMEQLAKRIAGAARYSWNIGHSLSYSYISYVTAWLETNYPLEYYVNLLNVNMEDAPQLKVLLVAMLHKGVKISTPNINTSKNEFFTDGERIYMGLQSVRQLGETASKDILEERQKGAFGSYLDFCTRMNGSSHVNKTVKENLVKARAFSWDTSLTDLDKINNTPLIQKIVKKYEGLLTNIEVLETINGLLAITGNNFTEQEELKNEKETLNFYITSHPITKWEPCLSKFVGPAIITPHMLDTSKVGMNVAMLCVVDKVLMKQTKKKDPYLYITVNDQLVSIGINIWKDKVAYVHQILSSNQLAIFMGPVKVDLMYDGEVRIHIDKVIPIIDGIPIQHMYTKTPEVADEVRKLLKTDCTISGKIPGIGYIITLPSTQYLSHEVLGTMSHLDVNFVFAHK